MKGLITSILAVIVLTSSAFAGNIVSTKSAKAYVMDFADWKTESVKVAIIDEEGNTLYSEKIATDSEPKRFNFNKLAAGTYTIKTSNEYKVRSQVLEINNGGIEVQETNTYFKPIIKYDSNLWDVNYLSGSKATTFTILDSRGEDVYTEVVSNTNIHKRFDIQNLPAGEYTLSVSNENSSSYQSIVKR